MDETRGSRPSGRSNLLSMKPTMPTIFQMEWDRVSGALEVLRNIFRLCVYERERERERPARNSGAPMEWTES